MTVPAPRRGEIWLADLNPIRGHEQGGRRPCLVVSSDTFNQGPAGLVVVLPVTSRDKHIRFHVPLAPPQGGVTAPSFIKPEDIRSISIDRLVKKMGAAPPAAVQAAEQRLRALLDLFP